MRVCMLAYTNYDTDNRVRRYAETLVDMGHNVDAIVYREHGQSKYEKVFGVNVFRILKRNYKEQYPINYLVKLSIFLIKSFFSTTLKHLKNKYDIIHVHSIPDFEVFAAFIPKIMGTKIILDIHDIVPEFYIEKFKVENRSLIFWFLILIERLSIKFSDHVIIANHLWEKRLISRSIEPSKCTTILNYPNTKIFYHNPKIDKDKNFIMIYPGTLNWHQGLDIAIRAINELKDELNKFEFHIYGIGSEKTKLQNLVSKLNLKNIVFFKPYVPLTDIARFMAMANIGIVPKRKDAFGNEAFSTKILEFMATGVPVIAANTTIDKFYFNDTQLMFFNSGDVKDLSDKIKRLYHDRKLRKQFIDNGYKLIEKYNWNANKHIYFDILNKLIGNKLD